MVLRLLDKNRQQVGRDKGLTQTMEYELSENKESWTLYIGRIEVWCEQG